MIASAACGSGHSSGSRWSHRSGGAARQGVGVPAAPGANARALALARIHDRELAKLYQAEQAARQLAELAELAKRRALDTMPTTKPCLVLLDLMMPVMDGWQVIEAMKHDPELKDPSPHHKLA